MTRLTSNRARSSSDASWAGVVGPSPVPAVVDTAGSDDGGAPPAGDSAPPDGVGLAGMDGWATGGPPRHETCKRSLQASHERARRRFRAPGSACREGIHPSEVVRPTDPQDSPRSSRESSERTPGTGRHPGCCRGYDSSVAGRLPPWPPGAHSFFGDVPPVLGRPLLADFVRARGRRRTDRLRARAIDLLGQRVPRRRALGAPMEQSTYPYGYAT